MARFEPSRSLAALALAAALPGGALASGFAIPELSSAGLALSNAIVANHKELGAIPYNAAAMSFHRGHSLSLGGMVVKPGLSVTTANGNFDSESNDAVFVPFLQGVFQPTERVSVGITVGAPFGLETDWLPGTFTPPAPALAPSVATNTKLELLDVSPIFSYRINKNLSIGGGLDYYNARTVVFDTAAISIDGGGEGFGWNVGVLWNSGSWSFGAAYRSAVTIDMSGSFNAPGAALPIIADLNIPSRLQVGVRYQANAALAVEFDITRTGWSDFDELVVSAPAPFNTTLVTSKNGWNDVNAYRLGVSYQISQATQLRFGYTYDETPQPEAHFSARTPDADRHLFSIGIKHQLHNGWNIEASYMYVKFKDRTIDGPIQSGPDANGTATYAGRYESDVNLLGASISKSF